MSVEVKIQIRSTVKKQLNNPADGNTYSFVVCVQGVNGNHIEHFIKEIVFYMPTKASNPQEVRKEPPYLISGSTDVSFRLLIDLYLHASKNFKKVQYSYYINIPDKPAENSVCVKTLTFLNCPQDFKERLLLGGAEEINHEKQSEAIVPVLCKKEPVETIQNLEEINHEKQSEAIVPVVCKKEPVETIQNQEALDSQNTSKQNGAHFILKTEPTESADTQVELSDQLPDLNVHMRDVSEQNDSLVIQNIYCFAELVKENETLKDENKTLTKKFNDQESAIATCVEKLPVLENSSTTANKELNQLKQKAEVNEVEIEKLKSTIQMVMSEIIKHKNNSKETKGIRTTPELSANLHSSFVSDQILPNNRVRIITDKCSNSHSNLEGLALNADSNMIEDACKNQINSCNTSENEVSSTISHFSDWNDISSPSDIAKTFQTLINSCYNKTITEKFQILSAQNKFLSCIYDLYGFTSLQDLINSIVHLSEKPLSLRNSSLSITNSSTPSLSTEEHILNTEKNNSLNLEVRKSLTQCNTLIEQAEEHVFKEIPLQETARNELLTSSPELNRMPNRETSKEILHDQNCLPEEVCNVLQKVTPQIISHRKDEECNNLNPNEKDSNQNLLLKVLHKNTLNETANKCKEGEIQNFSSNQEDSKIHDTKNLPEKQRLEKNPPENVFGKATQKESANSNCQERVSLISNSIRLKNTSLNRKRTIFLPIPVEKKKQCRTKKSSLSSGQNNFCSIPCPTSLDISNSIKHSATSEQICPPVKHSLNAVTDENKTSADLKKITPKSDNVLTNSHITAKGNRNQSTCTCITTDSQLKKCAQKGTENKSCKINSLKKSSSFIKTVGSILKGIDDRQISESKLKYYIHSLTEFLMNPITSPNTSVLIFLILDHLKLSITDCLKNFEQDPANCIFLPMSESCIVSTLFEIEKKSVFYSKGLIKNILGTIHQLLMSKKRLNMLGKASLCRVYTEICKRKRDLTKPLCLCADLLKTKHKSASYLIASMVLVWWEPFSALNNQSDEEMLLIGSIVCGTVKNRTKKGIHNCSYIKEIVSEYFGYPSLPDVNAAINFLKEKIVWNCTQSSLDKSWMLTSSLVIIAAEQPWEWVETHLLNEFIIPNLSRFSREEVNEIAFALFCNLFVDVCYLNINGLAKTHAKFLVASFHNQKFKRYNFIPKCAKVFAIKLNILCGRKVSGSLLQWFERNCDKLNIYEFKEIYLRRHMYYNKKNFTLEDIIIT